MGAFLPPESHCHDYTAVSVLAGSVRHESVFGSTSYAGGARIVVHIAAHDHPVVHCEAPSP